ncbi:hypothetical protein FRC06_008587 [Ceratobasidium sp. 370]|nr:hypothetical protein FRC06_008587 [Ceratobasidium sp. 370]
MTSKVPYPQHAHDYLAAGAIMKGEINPRPAESDPQADAFLTARFWPLLEKCWSIDYRARPRITKIVQDSVFSDVMSGEIDDPLSLRQDPTIFGSARRYREQGDVAFRREAYSEAIDYFEQARQLFERIGDTHRTALCLRDLGWTHVRLGNHDLARASFTEARELCRSMVDLRAELDTVQDLAAAERAAGNLDLSRMYLEHAFEDCRKAGLHVRSGVSHMSFVPGVERRF